MLSSERSSWVLVTGAASGVGRAIAIAFAAAGANLVLADLDASGLEEACEAVWAKGRDCIARAVDVSDAEEMDCFVEWVHGEMLVPALDVLVNNAGIALRGPFLDTPAETWRRVLEGNLLGVVNSCRTFLPEMLRAGGRRRVVNVASLAGLLPAPNMSAYAAAKHAVVGFSESLALELRLAGAQVGVSTVCPRIINTDSSGHGSPARSTSNPQRSFTMDYAKRGAPPELVAEAIVRAVRSDRDLILIGPFAKPLYGLCRLSRSLSQLLVLGEARCSGHV